MRREHRTRPDARSTSQSGERLDCRVETYDDHEECTVFPAGASDDELVTRWVTATDDAFVSLADCR